MIGQLLSIARNTFVESIRQPIYFVLVMLCGVLQVFATWGTAFSMGSTDSAEVSSDNKMLLDIGLATVFVCGTLLAAFVATAVLSREIENKTILTVVSKPIGRPAIVFGKYLGVAGAILMAVVIMLLFLLLSVRHGVLITAADDPDGPVILFSVIAVGLVLLIAMAGNYLYGWVFSQTSMLLMLPAMLLAYMLVLSLSKEWHWQPVGTDFKPQITLACACLTLAILVLTAVATAASTRLGQVMTIVICAGVFLMGLLSNHLIGRHAFANHPIAIVKDAQTFYDDQKSFTEPDSEYVILLGSTPVVTLRPGMQIYYGANPNGVGLAVPPFGDAIADETHAPALGGGPDYHNGIYITDVQGTIVNLKNAGPEAVAVSRPPQVDDWIFLEPTTLRPGALIAWAVIPNMHFFWFIDAITQNQPIPGSHVIMIVGYALAQIAFFLGLAVVLFQKRDVG